VESCRNVVGVRCVQKGMLARRCEYGDVEGHCEVALPLAAHVVFAVPHSADTRGTFFRTPHDSRSSETFTANLLHANLQASALQI
jgi:hypothetical protein